MNSGLIRPHQKLISFFQQWLDLAIILLALPGCYYLFHDSAHGIPKHYWLASIFALSAYYFFALKFHLYSSWRSQSIADQQLHVLKTWVSVLISLSVLAWAFKVTENFSRLTLGSWAIITPLLLLLQRSAERILLHRARNAGKNTRRIAIAGCGQSAFALVTQIEDNPWMGYSISGFFADSLTNNQLPQSIKYSGILDSLLSEAKKNNFDEIFIALPMKEESSIARLVKKLADCSCPVHIIPDLFTFQLLNSKLSYLGNIATVSIYDTPHEGIDHLLKRLADVSLSLLILVLISPLMLIVSLAIKLTSKGPVIFKQTRYGIGGEEITIYKFRSMTTQDDGESIIQASKGDARITPLGAFLRRTSIDELPQFINVLQGRMSIVGPRPHAVAHNELYRKDIDGYMLRHLVKPGITGWAQVNGWRGETDTLEKMEKRIEFDLFYIRNWSIALDLKIISLTILKGFINENAY